jgi:hypothetical protein
MTTGCTCPRCGNGLAPSKREQCHLCDRADMTAVGRVIDKFLFGEPLTINSVALQRDAKQATHQMQMEP